MILAVAVNFNFGLVRAVAPLLFSHRLGPVSHFSSAPTSIRATFALELRVNELLRCFHQTISKSRGYTRDVSNLRGQLHFNFAGSPSDYRHNLTVALNLNVCLLRTRTPLGSSRRWGRILHFLSAPFFIRAPRTGVSRKQVFSAWPTHPYRERAPPLAYTFSYVPVNALTTIVRGPTVSQALSLMHGINVDSGRFWISTA